MLVAKALKKALKMELGTFETKKVCIIAGDFRIYLAAF